MIEHNGKHYARVSDIIRPFSNYGNIDPYVLQKKAVIGSSVHQAIADDIAGEFPSPLLSGWGYYESYEAWKYNISPNFLRSEERYFCDKKMITGQIDCIVKIGKDDLLVDFKTSTTESPTWEMQAHLYHYLLAENGISVSNRMLFIKLSPLGDLPMVFEYKFSKNILAKCMLAVDSYWKNENVENSDSQK